MTTTPSKTSKPNDAPAASKVKVDERKLQNHLFNEFLPVIKLSAQDCDQDELQLKMHALKMFADIDPQDGKRVDARPSDDRDPPRAARVPTEGAAPEPVL